MLVNGIETETEYANHGTLTGPEGIGFVSSATFSNRRVTYAVIDGMAVVEGDIILGKAADVPTSPLPVTQGIGIVGERYRWPNKSIPFLIDNGFPNPNRVTDAIAHWHAHTAIRFVAQTNQVDYVRFVTGGGCSSSVGRQGGEQRITLGDGCTTGNAIHEIGHTVGLWHEQSRADRDHFVTIVWTNIQAAARHNFDQQISDGTDIGAYDYGSIMHYGAFGFAIDPSKPTIVPVQAGVTIGQRVALSPGDLAAVLAMYP